MFAALSACVAASVATSVDRRAASLSLLAELESIDLEINTIKRGDQTPLTTDDRLLARSAYEVEAPRQPTTNAPSISSGAPRTTASSSAHHGCG